MFGFNISHRYVASLDAYVNAFIRLLYLLSRPFACFPLILIIHVPRMLSTQRPCATDQTVQHQTNRE